jgi:hypothetical protein
MILPYRVRKGEEISTVHAALLMGHVSTETPVNLRVTYSNLNERLRMFHDPYGFIIYLYAQTQNPDVESIEISNTKFLEKLKCVN